MNWKKQQLNTNPIVSMVWSFCTTLRDDGVGYGDYPEQLTYLIYGEPARSPKAPTGKKGYWETFT